MADKIRCRWCCDGGRMQKYHDEEWGIWLHDDQKQFEFLMMEVMQCGLSWNLMLKKREIFRQCFDDFDFHKIAGYGEEKIREIMETEGMIRSERKIRAVIHNARCFLKIIGECGSFDSYLWGYTQGRSLVYRKHRLGEWAVKNELSDRISADLKKRGFKYLGSVTVYSHLQAAGIINDHEYDCWMYPMLTEGKNVEYID